MDFLGSRLAVVFKILIITIVRQVLDVQYGGFAAEKRGMDAWFIFWHLGFARMSKNKSSVQKNLFAAEGGCLATKKTYRNIESIFCEKIEQNYFKRDPSVF